MKGRDRKEGEEGWERRGRGIGKTRKWDGK